MRTARTTSRRIAPAGTHERLGPLAGGHRAGRACFLAGLVMALIFGLSGCGAGNGGAPSARPSTEPSGSRPATSGTESPRTTATPPTRPPRTSVATPTTRPPTSVAPLTSDRPPTTPKTSPATSAAALTPSSTSTPPASGTPASAESGGVGGSWLGAADPAPCRAGRRLVDLEVAQDVGLGRRSRRAGDGDPHRHKHAAAIGPDRRDSGAAGPLVATTAFRPDRPHAPVGPPGRPRIRRPEKEPVRADPQLAPGAGRSGGRRERSAGNRA
jgi:hypothetical protein